MMIIHNGVATKLSQIINHLVTIHCAAHKLQCFAVIQKC